MSPHCILWYGMVLYFIWSYCTVSHCYVPLLQRAGELPRSASSHFRYIMPWVKDILFAELYISYTYSKEHYTLWIIYTFSQLKIYHTLSKEELTVQLFSLFLNNKMMSMHSVHCALQTQNEGWMQMVIILNIQCFIVVVDWYCWFQIQIKIPYFRFLRISSEFVPIAFCLHTTSYSIYLRSYIYLLIQISAHTKIFSYRICSYKNCSESLSPFHGGFHVLILLLTLS